MLAFIRNVLKKPNTISFVIPISMSWILLMPHKLTWAWSSPLLKQMWDTMHLKHMEPGDYFKGKTNAMGPSGYSTG